jgi:2-polyprenyl-3-methyl-5-hydroxy-6-metoxy-1,4-benzoquinol methylase
MADLRLLNEIEHGKYLATHGAGEIWNWETPAGKLRWARRVKMLSSKIKSGMEVLELGCGTGYFTKELIKTGANITAIDISPDLLAVAKKEIVSNNVSFIIENAYGTKFTNEQFDRVVGSSVLHHLDIDKALPEIYRVLKSGGEIFFTEPNMLNPQIAMQKNISWLKKRLGDSPNETAFFKYSLRKKLFSCGFKHVDIRPFDFLHPQIPECLVPLFEALNYNLEKIPFIKEIAGSLYIEVIK